MAMPSLVRIRIRSDSKFGDHAKHVEQEPSDRVVGVVDCSAQVEFDVLGGEFVDDVPGIGQGASQAIELGDHQRVAGSACRERLPQTRSLAVSTR
jgi:hypothetical protein